MMAKRPEIPEGAVTAMTFEARNCNREIRRTGEPVAGGYAWLWTLGLAAGTLALGGCCHLPQPPDEYQRCRGAVPMSRVSQHEKKHWGRKT